MYIFPHLYMYVWFSGLQVEFLKIFKPKNYNHPPTMET